MLGLDVLGACRSVGRVSVYLVECGVCVKACAGLGACMWRGEALSHSAWVPLRDSEFGDVCVTAFGSGWEHVC